MIAECGRKQDIEATAAGGVADGRAADLPTLDVPRLAWSRDHWKTRTCVPTRPIRIRMPAATRAKRGRARDAWNCGERARHLGRRLERQGFTVGKVADRGEHPAVEGELGVARLAGLKVVGRTSCRRSPASRPSKDWEKRLRQVEQSISARHSSSEMATACRRGNDGTGRGTGRAPATAVTKPFSRGNR